MKEGIYELVVSELLEKELSQLDEKRFLLEKEQIDGEEANRILSRYANEVIRRGLAYIRDANKKEDRKALLHQIRACNEIIEKVGELAEEESINAYKIDEKGEMLTALYHKIHSAKNVKRQKPVRPVTSLSTSSLFTGSKQEPDMLAELKREIQTSDHICMLVSFIKWSGLRCIIEELKSFVERDNTTLKIITTSYMGATDFKAIETLSELRDTQIRISYDTRRTRLHAKAYIFKRETGFTTAYIGSSNLSSAAITSGLEWNVKVTEKESFDMIAKMNATFDTYWNDSEFVSFENKESDRLILRESLEKESGKNGYEVASGLFDIRPYNYQKEILEQLRVERELFDRHRNLIVAATGVGKTVIAAFDYKNFQKKQKKESSRLLFIAHRREILEQSLATFRGVLKDQNFGELYTGIDRPREIDHLFMTVQTFRSVRLWEDTDRNFYDYIIVDEFHHASAKSYQKLLSHYQPKILLGLTATPERMDGQNVLEYFDDRIAAEMRLPEAIDKQLLAPFQYFAVTDTVDFSTLKWSRGGYDEKELEKVLTENDYRVDNIVKALNKYTTKIDEIIGLGFCVSVKHAKYMADSFERRGIPSVALSGASEQELRQGVKNQLVSGEIRFIFTVDLFNEGVDIPEINTVLFLRPTQSLTVFTQQLGRGLRQHEDKECLTVLDFVGQAHARYDFEQKFKALSGESRHSVEYGIQNGFSHLPKGCYIHLEKQAKEYVLRNIKEASASKSRLVSKIRHFEQDSGRPCTLSNFMAEHHYELTDIYGKNGNRSFYKMKAEAGVMEEFQEPSEDVLLKRYKNFFHLNSYRLIEWGLDFFKNPWKEKEFSREEQRFLAMYYYSIFLESPRKIGYHSFQEALGDLIEKNPLGIQELMEILSKRKEEIDHVEKPIFIEPYVSLGLHGKYSTAQILAAFGYYNEEKKPSFREGVLYLKEKNTDVFFITLNKSEKDYSESTMYEDYALNERLFHWQSQSRTSIESETGKRYISHKERGGRVILFVREYKNKGNQAMPYVFLGEAEYVSHQGDRPISIVWRLKEDMPPTLLKEASKGAV